MCKVMLKAIGIIGIRAHMRPVPSYDFYKLYNLFIFHVIPSGYNGEKKTMQGKFEKWNAIRCKHSIFQNALTSSFAR